MKLRKPFHFVEVSHNFGELSPYKNAQMPQLHRHTGLNTAALTQKGGGGSGRHMNGVAQITASPARGDAFWPMENPKMP